MGHVRKLRIRFVVCVLLAEQRLVKSRGQCIIGRNIISIKHRVCEMRWRSIRNTYQINHFFQGCKTSLKKEVCLRWVSNPVPSLYKRDALPFELRRRNASETLCEEGDLNPWAFALDLEANSLTTRTSSLRSYRESNSGSGISTALSKSHVLTTIL